MKKLILVALTIITILNPTQVLAQLSLTCPTQGSLTLTNQYNLATTQPAQCSFVVDNTVSNIDVTITLSEPTLNQQATTEKIDPAGTSRTAQLTYTNNSSSKTIHQNSSTTDTFSGSSTTPMAVSIQIQRPQKFFAGFYTYELMINITSP
ncbi:MULTISPECIES: hypothetical protein [Nostocales]|jgi:hypothetical protein|uniref:hypothetical protein n=1 Tax=Nostocales TaxID=1161 RepID=UPI0006AC4348|nr:MULTISPECIES: hypothetical protein [Nostocales]ALB42536.1 hypothetical protein AA650_20615 [Anabaena sp. WA102]MTJ16350.1 hypothetical protein [Dolichospermum sp. UHCC 0299]MTJ21202.1 hypothetical protein [Dolichospermum sp. UHCC 0352]MTJ40947.1 hypothetical protein [Dolichospermum sp. UHCC 0406]